MKSFMWAVLAIPLVVSNLTACGSSDNNPGKKSKQPNVPGVSTGQSIQLNERHYLLALPDDFREDKAYKLLLAFHGSGSNSAQMQSMTGFERLSADYIVAYPKSREIEWNEGCGCNIAHRLGADDLGFIEQVMEDVGGRYRLQEGEVYAVGFSQGALFAQNVACNLGHKVKAIAGVGAPMSKQLAQSCSMEDPVSIMMVHGKADKVLPYTGSSHPNFGLLSSEDAVARLAMLNNSLPNPLLKPITNDVDLISYSNGKQKTQLYSIEGGGHNWNFSGFNTSGRILAFFENLHTSELPKYSRLVEGAGKRFHVRSMGTQNEGPAIVLLAGPNYNYHSDTAWFALLQPYLAERFRVHAVDRLGNGFSDTSTEVSYRRFADDLAEVLVALNEEQVVLVAFSSASISASLFYQFHQDKVKLAGMLWVDPDIPLPHSLSLYKGYPADWYLANLDALLPHLEEGNWTERTRQKLLIEREEIAELVAPDKASMLDWDFLDVLSQQRLLVGHQQTRAREIAGYGEDLDVYATLPLPSGVPVTVIDSDFEEKDIAANPDNAEALRLWQQEGSAWSRHVAEYSGGHYIPLQDADHMVMFQYPEVISQSIEQLLDR